MGLALRRAGEERFGLQRLRAGLGADRVAGTIQGNPGVFPHRQKQFESTGLLGRLRITLLLLGGKGINAGSIVLN